MGRISSPTTGYVAKNPLAVHIGGQLLKLRQKRQLPMRGVADAAGTTESCICHLENGKRSPSVGTLWKLSRALDVPVSHWVRGYKDEAEAQ